MKLAFQKKKQAPRKPALARQTAVPANRPFANGSAPCAERPARPSKNRHRTDVTDGERLLAQELGQLTLAEREDVYNDIHGIAERNAKGNDGRFVQSQLDMFDVQLAATKKNRAYSIVAFLAPATINDRHFRINILRKNSWDATAAARMFVKYFEARAMLFGEDMLTATLSMHNMPQDVRESLEAGAVVVKNDCPTDAANRRLMLFNYRNFRFHSGVSVLQAVWYLAETLEAFDSTVPVDYVVVVNMVGATLQQYRTGIRSTQLMNKYGINDAVPMEMTSTHMCFNNTRAKPIISLIMKASPRKVRLRMKLHYGTLDEILLELATYGIPREILDMDSDTQGLANEGLSEYLREIHIAETGVMARMNDRMPEGCIFAPRPTDVLMGRGRPYQSHAGNVALTNRLRQLQHEYNRSSQTMPKTVLAEIYVDQIRETGVRFLKRDTTGNYWQEISKTEARQKVMMTIRNFTRV